MSRKPAPQDAQNQKLCLARLKEQGARRRSLLAGGPPQALKNPSGTRNPMVAETKQAESRRAFRLFVESVVYLSFSSVCLMASKFGSSFGVGVCSLYCTTPF